MVVAISAVVIGACALVVAFYEVRIMRADQRASVLPLVELNHSTLRRARDAPGVSPTITQLKFSAENVGIGPAKIVNFRVTVDGRPFTTWGDTVRALLGREESINYSSSTIMGRTIPVGQTIEVFSMSDTELADDIYANIDRLDFEACFCSVFNECWTASFQKFGITNEARSCKPDADSFRE